MTYPLHLDLVGKRVLVVGAGTVAARRINDLLDAGADVVVVAPLAIAPVAQLADRGLITWRQREFAVGDVLGAWLVHATTNVPSVNAVVVEEARHHHVWAVRADEAVNGDARTPAVAVVGNVVVSVTTGDPRRSTELRDGIKDQLVDGRLAARPRRSQGRGSVVLIGGGPGDPDLITVRGRRELFEADVVVYDRLGPTSLLDHLSPSVELIDAGKSPGRHAMTQEQINEVIVGRALAGRRVARLKGGDPFVLGRGSEEVIACADAGVRVDVIPGISSAIAAPAAAGIPVTHRGVSTGFVVISGHVVEDLAAVASTGLTAVVLMGMATLPRLVEQFVDAGRPATTPVAIVHRAFEPQQRVVVGTLADIELRLARAKVTNPSVIVIGDVVGVVPALAAEVLAS